jgi:hypothetical protein
VQGGWKNSSPLARTPFLLSQNLHLINFFLHSSVSPSLLESLKALLNESVEEKNARVEEERRKQQEEEEARKRREDEIARVKKEAAERKKKQQEETTTLIPQPAPTAVDVGYVAASSGVSLSSQFEEASISTILEEGESKVSGQKQGQGNFESFAAATSSSPVVVVSHTKKGKRTTKSNKGKRIVDIAPPSPVKSSTVLTPTIPTINATPSSSSPPLEENLTRPPSQDDLSSTATSIPVPFVSSVIATLPPVVPVVNEPASLPAPVPIAVSLPQQAHQQPLPSPVPAVPLSWEQAASLPNIASQAQAGIKAFANEWNLLKSEIKEGTSIFKQVIEPISNNLLPSLPDGLFSTPNSASPPISNSASVPSSFAPTPTLGSTLSSHSGSYSSLPPVIPSTEGARYGQSIFFDIFCCSSLLPHPHLLFFPTIDRLPLHSNNINTLQQFKPHTNPQNNSSLGFVISKEEANGVHNRSRFYQQKSQRTFKPG